ncbi:MAG: hypothetical protein LUE20_07215 [Oscillospiraceae bacterium]|nr:hypothetical protein [Oscillospiraceae bacterium]
MSEQQFFEYKGFPLVRKGNELYYGSMGDKEVVYMQIASSEKRGDVDVATKVRVYRMLTDENVPVMERITKTTEKRSLFEAVDLAHDWLATR